MPIFKYKENMTHHGCVGEHTKIVNGKYSYVTKCLSCTSLYGECYNLEYGYNVIVKDPRVIKISKNCKCKLHLYI